METNNEARELSTLIPLPPKIDSISCVQNELFHLVQQIPGFSDIPFGLKNVTLINDRLLISSGQGIHIYFCRGDGVKLEIIIKRNATVRELKKKIQVETDRWLLARKIVGINWKYTWKRHWLVCGQIKLIDDNDTLEKFGIADTSEVGLLYRLRRTKT